MVNITTTTTTTTTTTILTDTSLLSIVDDDEGYYEPEEQDEYYGGSGGGGEGPSSSSSLWIYLLTMFGLLIISCISFWCQATVTEERFVPALNVFCTMYNIPDDIAGATFMSAGASSPELFGSLVSLFITHSSLGLGTIVGSEIFNQLIICCGAIYASPTGTLQLQPTVLIREVFFYALSILLLYISLRDVRPIPSDDDDPTTNHIYIHFDDALLLCSGYILYIIVCANMNSIIVFFVHQITRRSKDVHPIGDSSNNKNNEHDDTKKLSCLTENYGSIVVPAGAGAVAETTADTKRIVSFGSDVGSEGDDTIASMNNPSTSLVVQRRNLMMSEPANNFSYRRGMSSLGPSSSTMWNAVAAKDDDGKRTANDDDNHDNGDGHRRNVDADAHAVGLGDTGFGYEDQDTKDQSNSSTSSGGFYFRGGGGRSSSFVMMESISTSFRFMSQRSSSLRASLTTKLSSSFPAPTRFRSQQGSSTSLRGLEYLFDSERPSDEHDLYDIERNSFNNELSCFLWQRSYFYNKSRFSTHGWCLRWFTFDTTTSTSSSFHDEATMTQMIQQEEEQQRKDDSVSSRRSINNNNGSGSGGGVCRMQSVPDRRNAHRHKVEYPQFQRVEVDQERLIIRVSIQDGDDDNHDSVPRCTTPTMASSNDDDDDDDNSDSIIRRRRRRSHSQLRRRHFFFMAPNEQILEEVVIKMREIIRLQKKEQHELQRPSQQQDGNFSAGGGALSTTTTTTTTSVNGEGTREKEDVDEDFEDGGGEAALIEFPIDGNNLDIFLFLFLYPIRYLMHYTIPDVRQLDQHGNPIGTLSNTLLAILSSLIWLMIGSYCMVWSLESLGDLLHIPAAILGVTVSAAGTSLPNYIASKIAASNGFGNMAVSNAFGSNTFNIMIGLGLPWLLYTSIGTDFQPYTGLRDEGIKTSVLILASTLMLFIVVVMASNFILYRWHGTLFLCLYIAYLIFAIGQVYW